MFGNPVDQGRVLFLALEDSGRRLKSRLVKQQIPSGADIIFHTAWQAFSDGGLMTLENAIRDEKISLAVIDTFSRAVGRMDQLDPAEMTQVIGGLQRIAQANQVSVLLIDHHRKGGGFEADPIADILGATAKAAAADGALGLYRQNTKREYSLRITGRDVEESELALIWDGLTCCWQSLGAADDVRENSLKADILQAMREIIEDGELATTRRIADRIGKDPGNVSRALADLMAAGKIRRIEQRGRERPYEPLS
jgi:DNA-binding transcriptional ArsR family regulator